MGREESRSLAQSGQGNSVQEMRGKAQNRGTYEEGKGKENSLSLANLAGTHLLAVMVRGTRWAVGVVRVQAGPPHIGPAHLGLVEQLPEALEGGKGAQFRQQLLWVQVGPLDVRTATEGRARGW